MGVLSGILRILGVVVKNVTVFDTSSNFSDSGLPRPRSESENH